MTNVAANKSNEEFYSVTESQPDHCVSQQACIPNADIYETKDAVLIWADMPGIDENSIDITLDKNSLIVEGHVEEYSPPEGFTQVLGDYPQRSYKRTFVLGSNAQRDGIQGTVKNGFLILIIPKNKETSARKISISVD